MQLLHEYKILPATAKQYNMASISMKEASSDFEVKEKGSSDVSLRIMNPVASGDNVISLNSTHKIKEESPSLIPCCEGRELQISEDLVGSGLSAISVKHDGVVQCLSMSRACEKRQVLPGLVKHRNSFRSLHRPDLKQVPYLRLMTPDEIETLFRGYAEIPQITKNETRETHLALPPEENIKTQDSKDTEAIGQDDGSGIPVLHSITETRSGAEDVPAGMRLHGARARLYTSVLAGAKAGDQLDAVSTNEQYETRVPVDCVPEDEVQIAEELQIILPPRCDDITADSSIASNSNNGTN